MRWKWLPLVALIIALGGVVASFASIQNGVVTTHFDYSSSEGENVNHFIDYNPTSTSFVYNTAGGTSTTSGSVDMKNYKADRHVQIAVKTLGSTSVTARVEGKSVAATTWGLIYEKVYTAVADEIVNIAEKTDDIRVGLKIAGNGTDTVSVIGQYHSKNHD
jgi:hypothetical protein